MKWVDNRPEIDPLTGASSSDVRFSGAGPADRSALEWSLRLAERLNTTVTAVCCGRREAEVMLRDALATGATRAILIEGSGQEPSRTVATRLAQAGRDADLICCGIHSVDRGSGSVPAFLAAKLGLPQALGLVAVESDPHESNGGERRFSVERRLDHGRRERLAVGGRSVLSFEAGPELRRASLAATLTSTTATIEQLASDHIDTTDEPAVIGRGPYRPRTKVKPPPSGDTRERLDALLGTDDGAQRTSEVHELDSQRAARLVVERLISWGYLVESGETTRDP